MGNLVKAPQSMGQSITIAIVDRFKKDQELITWELFSCMPQH